RKREPAPAKPPLPPTDCSKVPKAASFCVEMKLLPLVVSTTTPPLPPRPPLPPSDFPTASSPHEPSEPSAPQPPPPPTLCRNTPVAPWPAVLMVLLSSVL